MPSSDQPVNRAIRPLIRDLALPAVVLDLDGRVQLWNTAAERLFGWSEWEVQGSSLPIVPRNKREESLLLHRIVARGNAYTGLDLIRQKKDGSRVDVSLSASPLRDEAGEVIGILGVLEPVRRPAGMEPSVGQRTAGQQERDENRKAEEATAEIVAYFHQMVEQAPGGLWVLVEGNIAFANQEGLRLIGAAEAGQIIGKGLEEFLHPDQKEATLRQLRLLGGEMKEIGTFETRLVRPDGQVREIEITARTLNYQKLGTVQLVLRDTTERRSQEMARRHNLEQVHEAEKMEAVGRLAGGMAHDFNNLLMVVRGYSELLAARLGPENPLQKHAEEIQQATERAAALTKQLLAFDRKQMLVPRIFDPNEVVRRAEKLLRPLVRQDIEVVTVLDPSLGRAKADPDQFEQVIMNLALNARDAMPGKGNLLIETSNADLDKPYEGQLEGMPSGPCVMLAVSDTGVGIKPEARPHIFEPFFTTKERGRGTGLGLSAVYGIVKQSGGHIWVYSEQGKGTTFKVYLPRVEAAVDGSPADPPLAVSVPGTETVLLVEDEAGVRNVTREFLEANGYTVLEAGEGSEALLICERHRSPIHIMVTDVAMPGLTGPEVAQRARILRPEMRILFVSGFTNGALLHHGISEGKACFLQKLFSLSALGHKLREVLRMEKNKI